MARTLTAVLAAIFLAGGCANSTQEQKNQELLELGNSLDAWMSADRPQTSPAPKTDQPPVHAMIGGLEEKLAANPEDAKGWSLLAQSYAFTGRMEDARAAADKAIALGVPAEEMQARIVRAHSGMAK